MLGIFKRELMKHCNMSLVSKKKFFIDEVCFAVTHICAIYLLSSQVYPNIFSWERNFGVFTSVHNLETFFTTR